MVVVEDVVTTGGSTRETIQVATAAGAQVVAATAIVNRSGGAASLDVPLHALLELSLPTYDPNACPLCAQGVPISKPGSRQVARRARPVKRSDRTSVACRSCTWSVMRTLKIVLAYDGTDFVGWQRQAAGASIQGRLEEALAAIEGRPVTVVGRRPHRRRRARAGPGGAAARSSTRSRADALARALNAMLPTPSACCAVEEAPGGLPRALLGARPRPTGT